MWEEEGSHDWNEDYWGGQHVESLWMRREEMFCLNRRREDMRQRELSRMKTLNEGKREWVGCCNEEKNNGEVHRFAKAEEYCNKNNKQRKNVQDRNYKHSFLCPNLSELNVYYYK